MLSPQQLLKSSKVSRDEAWISDLDPLLEGNMKVLYRKTIPVEMRQLNEDGNQTGVKEMLNFRFYIRDGSESYSEFHMEINNDSDIFFTFVCQIDQRKFERMRKQQGLNFGFGNMLNMLVKQLELCDKNINQYMAIFYQGKNVTPRLDFVENIEYKRIELISFQFEALSEELLKDYVAYRFTKIKKMNELVQAKIKNVLGEVKLKNPRLLKKISEKINSDHSKLPQSNSMNQTGFSNSSYLK